MKDPPSTTSNCSKIYTSRDKWIVALMAGLLFLLIASPYMYYLVNIVTASAGVSVAKDGCPTVLGLLVNGVIFFLIVRMMMG
jgi:hypothetical protein